MVDLFSGKKKEKYWHLSYCISLSVLLNSSKYRVHQTTTMIIIKKWKIFFPILLDLISSFLSLLNITKIVKSFLISEIFVYQLFPCSRKNLKFTNGWYRVSRRCEIFIHPRWKRCVNIHARRVVWYICCAVVVLLQNGRASSDSSEDGAGSSASTSRGGGAGSGFGGCTGGWRSVFGAVSGRELRLYECAPWSPEAWASPSITCPLIATRWEENLIIYHIGSSLILLALLRVLENFSTVCITS